MNIETAAFAEGSRIPSRYTEDGANVSPPLRWRDVPSETRELALLVEDPDAPRARPFVHWIAFHIPPPAGGLPEGVPQTANVDGLGVEQGRNDFGRIGYAGPAPPKGHGTHHYHFRLFALDAPVDLKAGCDVREFEDAIRAHVLAETDYVGTYGR